MNVPRTDGGSADAITGLRDSATCCALILTRRSTYAYVPLSSRAPSAPVSDLVKYQEQANSAMYFRFNTQLGPPYQILVGEC